MDMNIFETAYLELLNARSAMSSPITTAQTKSILSGLSAQRQQRLAQTYVFKVQFNPSTLKFSANAVRPTKGKKGLVSDEDGETQDCELQNSPPKMNLSVSLVFDRSHYIDSSVQPEVEGFLAIAKNPFTRTISFNWGNQYYVGELNSVTADYTMFNTFGIPTRAKVDLSLELFDTA